MKKMIIIVAFLLLPLLASAKSHICATEEGVAYPNDRTVIHCTGLGENLKLSELLNKGYRVVTVTSDKVTKENLSGSVYFVTRWVIVIEK